MRPASAALAFLAATVAASMAGPSLAIARPLMITPTPSATPEATATPIAMPTASAEPTTGPQPTATPMAEPSPAQTQAPTPAPAESPASTPTPLPAPSATPAIAPTPMAAPTPLPPVFAIPVETPEPAPTPIDYAGGMPGAPPGPHLLRVGAALGLHLYDGQGWNSKDTSVSAPTPKSADFVGVSISTLLAYDLTPVVAAVGGAGLHSASHEDAPTGSPTKSTTTLNGWWADAGLRVQTPPARIGAFAQLAAGGIAAQRQIAAQTGTRRDVETWTIFAPEGHATAGATFWIAPGLDLYAQAAWMIAPVRFTPRDLRLNMGGAQIVAGATLRL